MFYSQLSVINEISSYEMVQKLDRYFSQMTPIGKKNIFLSNLIIDNNIEESKAIKVIKKLLEIKFLAQRVALRCPECGMLLISCNQAEDLGIDPVYCYKCDTIFDASDLDANIIYSIKTLNNSDDSVFTVGQQEIAKECELIPRPVAHSEKDSLKYHIEHKMIKDTNYFMKLFGAYN